MRVTGLGIDGIENETTIRRLPLPLFVKGLIGGFERLGIGSLDGGADQRSLPSRPQRTRVKTRIRASLGLREVMFTSALRIDRGVDLP